MIPVTVKEIAGVTGGRIVRGNPDGVVGGIGIDTRSLKRGQLFIPIKGERFDGHSFIGEALEKGAGGLLVETARQSIADQAGSPDLFVIEAPDTLSALGRIAGLVRAKSGAAVIGITGSTGKTSTKDILSALIGEPPVVVASKGNLNNEIGLPLTLLSAASETEVIIVEMGMRGAGQIASLAEYARPDIGVITNIGVTHMELLGSQENIAAAKSELAAALPATGKLILSYEDPWSAFIKERTEAETITFGLGAAADYSAADLSFDDDGGSSWRVVVNGIKGPLVKLAIPGRHSIENALAAIAAAHSLGVPVEEAAGRLAQARLSGMRLHVIEAAGGIKVVDDTYNANPTSMAGALDTLIKIKGARHIAVLGKMAELGEISDREHKRLGVKAAELSLDMLVGVGEETDMLVKSAAESGLPGSAAKHFAGKDAAIKWLRSNMAAGDVVLVKGSRAAGLEEVVAGLVKEN